MSTGDGRANIEREEPNHSADDISFGCSNKRFPAVGISPLQGHDWLSEHYLLCEHLPNGPDAEQEAAIPPLPTPTSRCRAFAGSRRSENDEGAVASRERARAAPEQTARLQTGGADELQ